MPTLDERIEAVVRRTRGWVDDAAVHQFILDLAAERERLRSALERMVYETTHLSPLEDDGSHWCKISREALEQSRAALASEPRA